MDEKLGGEMKPIEEAEITDALRDLAERQKRERARFHARKPAKIKNVMARVMQRGGYGQVLGGVSLARAWQTAAGAELAGVTRIGRLRRGVLEIIVANSTQLQELTFMKHTLLARLQALDTDQQIRELRFRTGEVA